ncbi:MOSC domain-containing protein [Winogradskyella sp. PE311]|uniref:MOSC domain-containing protein n=1 Tax=Winogradskyella sp. PE311 TaxID=3366943 RepID=UPI0039808E8D
MQVISTNIAQPTTIIWDGKEVTTGIYKKPTDVPIRLNKEEVRGDEVSDRRVHGGEFKACYLFSANQYEYWRILYPNLEWNYGMFGENITIEDLDEKELFIGDIYKLGKALVQITQPREPCFKFAHKFGSEKVLHQFINHGFSGIYVRVIKEGDVKTGDHFTLVENTKDSVSIFDFFKLLHSKNKNKDQIHLMLNNEALATRMKKRLKFFLK